MSLEECEAKKQTTENSRIRADSVQVPGDPSAWLSVWSVVPSAGRHRRRDWISVPPPPGLPGPRAEVSGSQVAGQLMGVRSRPKAERENRNPNTLLSVDGCGPPVAEIHLSRAAGLGMHPQRPIRPGMGISSARGKLSSWEEEERSDLHDPA